MRGTFWDRTYLPLQRKPTPLLLVHSPSPNPPPPGQAQLGKAEAQLAQRAEQGAAFSRVDFEQLRIEAASLAAKREARAAEVEKLRAKLAAAVQVGGGRGAWGCGCTEGCGQAWAAEVPLGAPMRCCS